MINLKIIIGLIFIPSSLIAKVSITPNEAINLQPYISSRTELESELSKKGLLDCPTGAERVVEGDLFTCYKTGTNVKFGPFKDKMSNGKISYGYIDNEGYDDKFRYEIDRNIITLQGKIINRVPSGTWTAKIAKPHGDFEILQTSFSPSYVPDFNELSKANFLKKEFGVSSILHTKSNGEVINSYTTNVSIPKCLTITDDVFKIKGRTNLEYKFKSPQDRLNFLFGNHLIGYGNSIFIPKNLFNADYPNINSYLQDIKIIDRLKWDMFQRFSKYNCSSPQNQNINKCKLKEVNGKINILNSHGEVLINSIKPSNALISINNISQANFCDMKKEEYPGCTTQETNGGVEILLQGVKLLQVTSRHIEASYASRNMIYPNSIIPVGTKEAINKLCTKTPTCGAKMIRHEYYDEDIDNSNFIYINEVPHNGKVYRDRFVFYNSEDSLKLYNYYKDSCTINNVKHNLLCTMTNDKTKGEYTLFYNKKGLGHFEVAKGSYDEINNLLRNSTKICDVGIQSCSITSQHSVIHNGPQWVLKINGNIIKSKETKSLLLAEIRKSHSKLAQDEACSFIFAEDVNDFLETKFGDLYLFSSDKVNYQEQNKSITEKQQKFKATSTGSNREEY